MREKSTGNVRLRRSTVFGRFLAFGTSGGLVAIAALVAMAPMSLGAVHLTITHVAPYKGGVLPTSYLNTYSCHAKAKQVVPWHFNLKTGTGGGSDSVSSKACSQIPYRLGSQSSATASGSEEVSVLIKIPTGTRNVTANLGFNYTAQIKESPGSVSGACPTTPFSSTSVSYNNGSAWSYWPTVSHPVTYTNSTYFYYYQNNGASGSCSSYASVSGTVVVVIIASNGLAGYAMNGGAGGATLGSFGGSVATYNNTYWSCYNYTLWNYGSWSNGTGGCSNSNQTVHSTSYNYQTGVSGTNSSMTLTGSISAAMWNVAAFHNISPTWTLFVIISGSVSAGTGGFPAGIAVGSVNMATAGNGITLKSITIV